MNLTPFLTPFLANSTLAQPHSTFTRVGLTKSKASPSTASANRVLNFKEKTRCSTELFTVVSWPPGHVHFWPEPSIQSPQIISNWI